MNINDYPKLIEKQEHYVYMGVILKTSICPKCGKYLLPSQNGLNILYGNSMFCSTQWAENSYAKVDDYFICKECAGKNLADFKCDLCNNRYPSSEIQESFGDPPDFLCKNCYKTQPALVWCEEVADLESLHRYDTNS